MMEKRNTTMCKVISPVLFVAGIVFLVVAFLGHESGYSAAVTCFAASTCMNVRRRKE